MLIKDWLDGKRTHCLPRAGAALPMYRWRCLRPEEFSDLPRVTELAGGKPGWHPGRTPPEHVPLVPAVHLAHLAGEMQLAEKQIAQNKQPAT